MKIWKIASASSFIFCLLFFGFLAYKIISSGASFSMGRVDQLFGHWVVGLVSVPLYLFTFILVLVSFPSFLFLCAHLFSSPLWLSKEGRQEIARKYIGNIYGLLISSFLLVVVLLVGLYIKDLVPKQNPSAISSTHNKTLVRDSQQKTLLTPQLGR